MARRSDAPIVAGTMTSQGSRGRSSALALAATSLLAIGLMALHPTRLDSLRNPVVHGGLMPVMLVQVAAYVGLAERLGIGLLRVRSALTLQLAAAAAWCGAAAVNGFVAPPLVDAAPEVIALAHETNQVLALLGALAAGGALVAWSLALVPCGGAARALGVAALGVAALVGAPFAHGQDHVDLHAMIGIVLGVSLWGCAAAVWMLRGTPTGSRPAATSS